ncbi:MAG: hypothetical protein Q9174_003706 [Haloplaca sp. 1 TL-2023]
MFSTKALGASAKRYISTVFGIANNYKNKPTIQKDLAKTMDHYVQQNPELAEIVLEAHGHVPPEITAESEKVFEAIRQQEERLREEKEVDKEGNKAAEDVAPPEYK